MCMYVHARQTDLELAPHRCERGGCDFCWKGLNPLLYLCVPSRVKECVGGGETRQ